MSQPIWLSSSLHGMSGATSHCAALAAHKGQKEMINDDEGCT
jgi:hypothetical protein